MVRYAENIRLGDPDPELFVVPADYTEMSPTQLRPRIQCQPDDARCLEIEQGRMDTELRMENKYWEAQQQKQN